MQLVALRIGEASYLASSVSSQLFEEMSVLDGWLGKGGHREVMAKGGLRGGGGAAVQVESSCTRWLRVYIRSVYAVYIQCLRVYAVDRIA